MLQKLKTYFISLVILSLTLQTSFIGNITKVKAASENITKLAIISSEQSFDRTATSDIITVETQNSGSTAEPVTESTILVLTTNSLTGLFSLDATNWTTTSIYFDSGSDKSFYYKDTIPGIHTITVSGQDKSWTQAEQQVTITDSTAPTSEITSPTNGMYAKNADVSGTATDDDGSADVSTVQVKIQANSGTEDGKFLNDGTTWGDYDSAHSWLTANGTDNWNYSFDQSKLTTGEEYTVYARAIDISGNKEDYHGNWFYFDNIAPIGSITINKGADVTNGNDWETLYSADTQTLPQVNLDLTYIDNAIEATTKFSTECSSRYMKISNDPKLDANGELIPDSENENSGQWINFAENYYDQYGAPWNLTPNDGMKMVYVQFKDRSGNVSQVYSDSIFYSHLNSGENATPIVSGTQVINPYDNVEMIINANTPTVLFNSNYSGNPAQNGGITFLNKYYDFNIQDKSAITFPVNVKIYFTAQDLLDAGITTEELQGMYYWDFGTSTWKLYSDTKIVMTTERAGYIGYVETNVDHFTPWSIGGDITAPEKPSNFTAATGDSEVTLNWNTVSDANGYYVRYRKATSVDNTSYSTVFISGQSTSSTKVNGLNNGTQYEFGIAVVDNAGNIGDYAVVVQTPTASSSTSSSSGSSTSTSTTSKIKNAFLGSAQAAGTTSPDQTQTPNQDNTQTIQPDNGSTEGTSTDETEGTNWSRIWVTIGILILAAAAGFGGYYGYQWWMGGTEEEKKEVKDDTKKKDNGGKKGGRW